jgi:hypothetical protein
MLLSLRTSRIRNRFLRFPKLLQLVDRNTLQTNLWTANLPFEVWSLGKDKSSVCALTRLLEMTKN